MATARDMVPLSTQAIGEPGIVWRIDVAGRTRRRLVEMGITPGTEITITRRAPLNDPIEVTLRGYTLTIREEDARSIMVVKGGTAQ